MSVLFTQPIFVPAYSMLKRSLDSLESIKANVDTDMFDIYFAGYAENDELWNVVDSIVKQISNSYLERFPENRGKGKVINYLVDKALSKKSYDYMVTCDSDIVFLEENKAFFLTRLLDCVEKMSVHKQKPVGMIGVNQAEGQCHWIHLLRQCSYVYNGVHGKEEIVLWNTQPQGIGGGCSLISLDLWKKAGGYKTTGTYGAEDALILTDSQRYNYSWQLLDTLYVKHPHETDSEYAKWKVGGNHSLQGSIDFWKNRK